MLNKLLLSILLVAAPQGYASQDDVAGASRSSATFKVSAYTESLTDRYDAAYLAKETLKYNAAKKCNPKGYEILELVEDRCWYQPKLETWFCSFTANARCKP